MTTTFQSHRFKLVRLVMAVLVLLSLAPVIESRRVVRTSKAKVNGKVGGAQASFPYLYATQKDYNASYPVIEYMAPTTAKALENDKPDFLYDPNQGYRIVVFYGHWCNTCKNFKPHFINFAQRVQQIANEQNEKVDIYAVSCHPNRRLCRKQTSTGYPIVRLFKNHALEGMDVVYTDINPIKALEKMGMAIDTTEYTTEDWDVMVEVPKNPINNLYPIWQRIYDEMIGNEHEEVRPYHRRTRDELKGDIHLSLDFALRDGVFTSDHPISQQKADALKEWLKLIHKTLPEAWEVHSLIEELLSDFSYIIKHEGYLTRVLDNHPTESSSWSEACSHGIPDEGYTCGLWEMFHAMTIGVVNYNSMSPELRRISPDHAAITLRNYIENFLGCIGCRNNFIKSFDACEFNRCTRLEKDASGIVQQKQKAWAELSLWLFEVHNDVNVRLVKEKAEREGRISTKNEEMVALWPLKEECLPCYNSNKKLTNVTWDYDNLYKWLQLEYGQLDSTSAAIRKDIHDQTIKTQRKLKKKSRRIQLSFGSMFGGICFILYSCIKVQRRLVTGRHKKMDDN